MDRRPWLVAALLGMVMATAGCGSGRGPEGEQLVKELRDVKTERDQLATVVRQLTVAGATLEAYTVNNRQGCLRRLRTVRQRLARARASLHAGEITRNEAVTELGRAVRRLDGASAGDCAPAAPEPAAGDP
jgi:hypothetical protein